MSQPAPRFYLEYLAQLREAHGLTQRQVAEHLGIDQSLYSRMETGKIGIRLPMLTSLSALLCVDPGIFWQPGGLRRAQAAAGRRLPS